MHEELQNPLKQIIRILTLRRRPRKVILFMSLHNKTNVNFSTLGLMYTKSDCPHKKYAWWSILIWIWLRTKLARRYSIIAASISDFLATCVELQMPSYPKCSHGTATSIRVPSRPRICKCTVSESSELQESLTDIDIFGPWIVPKAANSELSTLAPRCKKAWKISGRWSTQSTNTILPWSS